MSKDNKYKIPKTNALVPIIGYTLIFLIVVIAIFLVVSLLADYTKDVRSEHDRVRLEAIVEQYDAAPESERVGILDQLVSEGYEGYCIVDRNGEIVTTTLNKITCEG